MGVSGLNGMAEECITDQQVPRNSGGCSFILSVSTILSASRHSTSFPLSCLDGVLILCQSTSSFQMLSPLFSASVGTLAQSWACVACLNEELRLGVSLSPWSSWLAVQVGPEWGGLGHKSGLGH